MCAIHQIQNSFFLLFRRAICRPFNLIKEFRNKFYNFISFIVVQFKSSKKCCFKISLKYGRNIEFIIELDHKSTEYMYVKERIKVSTNNNNYSKHKKAKVMN